jgi:hypothetical protein
MIRTFCICALAVLIAIVTTACGDAANSPPAEVSLPGEESPATDGSEPLPVVAEPPMPPPPSAPAAPLPPTAGAPAPRPVDPRSRDRFDEMDAALGDLVSGNVAFNTPEQMRFHESCPITLIASPTMNEASLGEELPKRLGRGDSISVEALQVAPLMEARLDGAPAGGARRADRMALERAGQRSRNADAAPQHRRHRHRGRRTVSAIG